MSLKRTLLSLFSVVAVALPMTASAAEHSLRAGLALATRAARDDLLVPLAFSGGGLTLEAAYTYGSDASIAGVSARAGLELLANRHGHLGAAIGEGFELEYLRKLGDGEPWMIAVGPVLGWDADVFNFMSWDDAHGYWIGARWLGPKLRTSVALDAGYRLDLSGELAIAGFLARPPLEDRRNKQDALKSFAFYVRDVQSKSELAWLGDFQLLRFAADLSALGDGGSVSRLPSGWMLGAEARFLRANGPEPAFSAELRLSVGWAWTWGM